MLKAAANIVCEHTFGEVRVGVRNNRVTQWRESGAAKVRFTNAQEAVLINTGGGLAGGDRFEFRITAGENSQLAVTTQAAERVYKTSGHSTEVAVTISAEHGSAVSWVPQETILFQHSVLSRRLTCHLSGNAKLLCVEAVILGRKESGEAAANMRLRDSWRIRRDGKLVFAEELVLDSEKANSKASLAGAGAFATLLYVADDAGSKLEEIRRVIDSQGGTSAWSGKLVARILAGDGFMLRKSLIPALHVLMGSRGLPKTWSL
jgi:urease accessory protein